MICPSRKADQSSAYRRMPNALILPYSVNDLYKLKFNLISQTHALFRLGVVSLEVLRYFAELC
jgi:hypothetical protein